MNEPTELPDILNSPQWTHEDLAQILEVASAANNVLAATARSQPSAWEETKRAAACRVALGTLHQLQARLITAVQRAAAIGEYQLAVYLCEALGQHLLAHFDNVTVGICSYRTAIQSAQAWGSNLAESRLRSGLASLLVDSCHSRSVVELAKHEVHLASLLIKANTGTADVDEAEELAAGALAKIARRAGDLESAERYAIDAVAVGRQVSDAQTQGMHTWLLAEIIADQGHYQAAQQHFFAAMGLLAAAGDDLGLARVFAARCRLGLHQFRAHDHLVDAVTAVRMLRYLGYPRYLAVAKAWKAVIHHELGQRAEADQERAEALALVRPGTPSALAVQEVLDLPASLPQAAMLTGLRRLDSSTRAAGSPSAPPAVARVLPSQSPWRLVGRAGELDLLTKASDTITVTAPMVVGISGLTGIGKTALALRWAHGVGRDRARFPDGLLHAVLDHGALSPELATSIALDQFLRALGVPVTEIDASSALEAKRALFRRVTAGKRLLMVLDDVVDPEMVPFLLPGSPHSMVIVTSVDALPPCSAGQVEISLDRLSTAVSTTLLANVLGTERVEEERPAARRIAYVCAGIPVALLIVAAGLAPQPTVSLAEVATSLENALSSNDSTLDAVLQVACSWLPEATVRDYRRLSLLPLTTLSPSITAAALGRSTVDEGLELLETLADRGLLTREAPARYCIPDALGPLLHKLAGTAEGLRACNKVISNGITQLGYEAAIVGQRAAGERESLRMWLGNRQSPVGAVPPATQLAGADAYAWLERERISVIQATIAAIDRSNLSLAWMTSVALGRLCLCHGGVPEGMNLLKLATECIRDGAREHDRRKPGRYRTIQVQMLTMFSVVSLCGVRAVPSHDRGEFVQETEQHLHQARQLAGSQQSMVVKALADATRVAQPHLDDREVAETLHRLAIDNAHHGDDQRARGLHTWVLGTIRMAEAKDEEALTAFQTADQLLLDPVDKAAVLLSAAVLFADQRRLDRGIGVLEHAATLLQQPEHADLLAKVHAACALLSGMRNDRRQAIAFRDAALAVLPEAPDDELLAAALKPLEDW
ncbi:NB-ARC domain-containing protein [Crossiella cryophila]|uniref:Tetratricopeptide (TPR) repeat protein n=1 Tax=Crossiella cryophila TaxID=43355 RepID=A0A7W7CE21_9PSEU|nr:NB-ARC domain-containing protein [Crossiella cryophila]MBB4679424.1 tetratricopeptide (TPR) repeat protein [Crossiella cryophila]